MNPARAKILAHYEAKGRVLFAHDRNGLVLDKGGSPVKAGNSWSSIFWAGFNGVTWGVNVPTRTSIAYDWYMAGRAAGRAARRARAC